MHRFPEKAQRHRLAHLQRHLKDTAERSYHLYSELACEVLVFMEKTGFCILGELSPRLFKKEIISRIL